jgi:hypothetical protein
MSIGHLAEVERGDKHPGSEVFSAICGAMGATQYQIITDAANRLELEEQEQGVAA